MTSVTQFMRQVLDASTRSGDVGQGIPPYTCPACCARELSASRSASRREWLLSAMTPLGTFRCGRCGYRGWLLRPRAARARDRLVAAWRRACEWARWYARPMAHMAVLLVVVLVLVGVALGVRWVARGPAALAGPTASVAALGREVWTDARARAASLFGAPPAAAPAPSPPRVLAATFVAAKPATVVRFRVPRSTRPAAHRPEEERDPIAAAFAGLRAEVEWHAPRWGATDAEILGAHADTARRVDARGLRAAVDDLPPVVVQAADIGGTRCAVVYRFDRDRRLRAIEIRAVGRGADVAAQYDQLLAWVASGNGPPAHRGDDVRTPGTWDRRSIWRTDDSRIDLRAWNVALEDAHVLSVDLRRSTLQPAFAPGLSLVYEPIAAPANGL